MTDKSESVALQEWELDKFMEDSEDFQVSKLIVTTSNSFQDYVIAVRDTKDDYTNNTYYNCESKEEAVKLYIIEQLDYILENSDAFTTEEIKQQLERLI